MSCFAHFLLEQIGEILCGEKVEAGRAEGLRSESKVVKRQLGLQV